MNSRLKNNKVLIIVLIISLLLLGVISIAFAALSKTLNITSGNVTQNALTWEIGFVPGSYSPNVITSNSTGISCGTATVTANTITVPAMELSKPGDYVVSYDIPIRNNGDLTAYIREVTFPDSIDDCPGSGGGASANLEINSRLDCTNIEYYFTSLGKIENNSQVTSTFSVTYTSENFVEDSETLNGISVSVEFTDDKSISRISGF